MKIYTVDGFSAEWAAGPKIKKKFEETCNCHVEYVVFDNTASLFSRLKLEGKNSKADIVIGFDNNQVEQFKETKLFAPHHLNLSSLILPIKWDDLIFLPYDFSYFAFIYNQDKLKNPPTSFIDLISDKKNLSFIMADPRSCTSGIGLLLWVKSAYGDKAKFIWQKLSPKLQTITKNWGDAYALFMHGESDLILSYVTSPVYHILVENQHKYKAAEFKEGHYLQIELAAKLLSAPNNELADKFMQFILSDDFQEAIAYHNFMYPIVNLHHKTPAAYHQLIQPSKVLFLAPSDARRNIKNWLQEWLETFN